MTDICVGNKNTHSYVRVSSNWYSEFNEGVSVYKIFLEDVNCKLLWLKVIFSWMSEVQRETILPVHLRPTS
jgi:hypothetical protein